MVMAVRPLPAVPLGELDTVCGHGIDSADMHAVGADHLHILTYLPDGFFVQLISSGHGRSSLLEIHADNAARPVLDAYSAGLAVCRIEEWGPVC